MLPQHLIADIMIRNSPIRLLALACALASILLGAEEPVSAQQPSADTLVPVQVRVLRTPFDVTNAPFSVTVVGPRGAAAARQGFALDEVVGRVAGVQVDNRLNFALGERLSIRGIGARTQFGVRGVRVIVDGIPATLADGQTVLNNVDLASVGRAEVLRGPASSLYGNASGGVVTLQSAPAPDVPFRPRLRFLYGSDALIHGIVSGAGTHGQATYTVTADRLDYNGYRAFSAAHNTHVNAIATYTPKRSQIEVIGNMVRYTAQNPGSLSDSLLQIDRRQAYATNVLDQTGERGAQTQLGINARTSVWGGEWRTSVYGLQRAIDNPIPATIIKLHRLAGGARVAYAATYHGADEQSVTALAGFEADVQHDDRQNYANEQGTLGAIALDQLERVTSMSPFAQVSVVMGKVYVLGGVRYDDFRFAAADRFVTEDNPDDSGVRHMSALSPSIGVTYALNNAIHLYANTATSFQTPTTTELANRPDQAGGFNPSLQPEHTHSIETGMQGFMFGRVQYHIAVYRMRITGELIPFEVASSPGRDFYRNAGTAVHKGIETDLDASLTPSLTAHVSYGYTDARFAMNTLAGGAARGHRIPGVVPQLLTAAIDLGASDTRFVSLEMRAQSATPVNDANSASSPGYVVLNTRGEIPLMARSSLFGGIDNLFDRRYNTSVVVNAYGGRYFEPGAGRTVYVGLQWQ
jgi:iron complex outermembrane receptor protein